MTKVSVTRFYQDVTEPCVSLDWTNQCSRHVVVAPESLGRILRIRQILSARLKISRHGRNSFLSCFFPFIYYIHKRLKGQGKYLEFIYIDIVFLLSVIQFPLPRERHNTRMSSLAKMFIFAFPFLMSLGALLSPHFLSSTKLPIQGNSFDEVGYTSSLLGECNNPKLSSPWQLAAIAGVTTCILLFVTLVMACRPSSQDIQTCYKNDMQIVVMLFVSLICSITTITAAYSTNICNHNACENAMGGCFQIACNVATVVIGLPWLLITLITLDESQRAALKLVANSSALKKDAMDPNGSNNDPTNVLTAIVVSTSSSHGMSPDKGHALENFFDKSGYQIVDTDSTNCSC